MSNETDRRRLIVGAATGYRPDQVRMFVESLRATGYSGDVMMLVGYFQWRLKAYLRRHGVHTVSSWSTRKLHGPIHAYRFEKFAEIVHANAERYDQVMVSDVRDVVFQKHPFDGVTSPACHFYLEGNKTIGNEPTNARWAKLFLSPGDAAKIGVCLVSCCGVVLGGIGPMNEYLARLAGYLHALPMKIRRKGGADTVFHNKMAHLTHEVSAVIVENNVHVASMGLEPPSAYIVDERGQIRTVDGHLPAILHQYDRIPHVRDAVEARFRLPRN